MHKPDVLLFSTEKHSINIFSSHPLLGKWQTNKTKENQIRTHKNKNIFSLFPSAHIDTIRTRITVLHCIFRLSKCCLLGKW